MGEAGEQMSFPDSWEEFVKHYQINDKEQVYSNGVDFISVFRVKQMMSHYCPEHVEIEGFKFPHVVGQPAEICYNGKWIKGKIVAGYRFQDGIVTIETPDGKQVWCGEAQKDYYRPLPLDEEC